MLDDFVVGDAVAVSIFYYVFGQGVYLGTLES